MICCINEVTHPDGTLEMCSTAKGGWIEFLGGVKILNIIFFNFILSFLF